MQEAYRKQVQDVETTYNAIIEIARQAGISTVGLEKQKQQEISQLEFDYQNSLYQIQSQIGVSWAQEYQNELALLKNLHDQELIDEKTYQRKKLQMQMNNAKNTLTIIPAFPLPWWKLFNRPKSTKWRQIRCSHTGSREQRGRYCRPGRREGK